MKDLSCFEPKYRTLIGYLTGMEIADMSAREISILRFCLYDVAGKTKITEEHIMSKMHDRDITEARHIYFKVARERGISLKKIGKYIGIKSHESVLHGISNVDTIPTLQKKYREFYK